MMVDDRKAGHGQRTPAALPTTREMWIPLIAVILVLAVLAVAPVVVGVIARRLRTVISDVIDPAELRTSDLSASLSEEMFTVGMHADGPGAPQAPVYRTALAAERRDALALDSLVRLIGTDAATLFTRYREAARRWHDDVDAMRLRPPSASEMGAARTDGMAVLAAVRQLSDAMEQLGTAARARARRVERIDVYLPVAIVPLALLACVLVVRAGRRTVDIALRAERDHRALAIAMDQKSAFMRGISHDLQNPLGAARGHLDLMLEGMVTPDQQQNALLRIRRLVTTASETVTSLLSIARSETGEMPLDLTVIDLCALVQAAVEDHVSVARMKQQTVSFESTSENHVTGDAGRIRHIVDNLLSNSSKYTPTGGRIRVGIGRRHRESRPWSTVTVQDSGPGIPLEWRERVFEEFTRVPASRDIAPGTGIGLAVSRRMARMMGGDLTLDANSDRPADGEALGGAVFVLSLPAAETAPRL
jgi:signal transduction histidine kinase